MDLNTFQFQDGCWSPPLKADPEASLVIAFGARHFGFDKTPFLQLQNAFPNAMMAGCSTAGEILGTVVSDDTVVVVVARFRHTRLQVAYADVACAEDSECAGKNIATSLLAPDLRVVLVFSDGSRVNGSHLVAGLNAYLPPQVVVSGGLAGDGTAFGSTWVLKDGQPKEGVVSAVGFYGDRLRVSHGSRGGWDFFGPERVVTRSKDHLLFEVDGRPALDLYKEYLGERVAELPASALLFPLSIRAHRGDANRVVRTVLSVDEAAKSMTFAGNVPTGHLAQLMRANVDRLVGGAEGAAESLQKAWGEGTPQLCIAVSCVGRKMVLGARVEEEVEAVLEYLGPETVQIGFYSYGEISPTPSGPCDLHNQTMTLVAFGED